MNRNAVPSAQARAAHEPRNLHKTSKTPKTLTTPRRLRALALLLALSALRCGGPAPVEPSVRPEPGAAVQALAISPSNVQVAQGTVQPFTARGLLADGQSRDMTARVRWTVRDEAGRAVDAPSGALLPFARPGRYVVTADLADRSVSTPVTVTAATLSSLSVSPSTPSVPKGLSKAFKATAKFSDGTSQDVTAMAAWSVKDTVGTGVAVVDSAGVATAKAVGKARIQARYLTKTSYTTMEVTPATLVALSVSPSNPSIAKGTSQVFTAMGAYSDGSTADVTAQVTWAVADVDGSGVAAIDSAGVAFGKSVGKATVSAELDGQLSETRLTVTAAAVSAITLSPSSASIAKGLTQRFTAQAALTDGSTQDVTLLAAWSAADLEGTAVASVDSTGLCRGSGVGKARIDVSYGGKSASAVLQVSPAILIALQVEPSSLTLPKGVTAKLQAIGSFTDGTTQDLSLVSIWSTTDTTGSGVASVDASGQVQARSVGTARIDVSYGARSASATVQVTSAIVRSLTVDPRSVQLTRGGKQVFTATATLTDGSRVDVSAAATWTASDVSGSGVASIDRTGTLTANADGRAEVKVAYAGYSDTAQVAVGGFVVMTSGTVSMTGLRRIWGGSDDDVWITGWDGALLRWNGSTFTRTALTTEFLYAIWGTTASDIWAAGTGDKLWHFDGTSWRPVALGTSRTVYEIWGSGPRDVWFATTSGMLHWDGSALALTPLTGLSTWSVWGTAATDVWAVGGGGKIAHFDGTTWTLGPLPAASGEVFESIQGSGPRDIWTVGSGGSLLHFDGTSWQKAVHPEPGYTPGLAVRSATEAWAVSGSGKILRWDGTSWTLVPSPTKNMLFTLWASPSGRIWGAGAMGTVVRN
ncbi:MAG: Ig-like domain-containing protein [Polyangia bacterium]